MSTALGHRNTPPPHPIEVSRWMTYKFLKLYGKSWPKFEQVAGKVPTPRTLELLAFDEMSTFEFRALFGHNYTASLGLYAQIKAQKIKTGLSIES